MTKLLLHEIPSTDCRVLKLADSSFYDPALKVQNALLEVQPPGETCGVFFKVQKGFLFTLNSSNLRILPAKAETDLTCIPDGIYKIKYSISPNLQTMVEYELLRNTIQLNAYHKAVAELFLRRCKMTKKCFEEQRAQLIWIKELIDAAKYLVEEVCASEDGIQLYNEANRLLVNYNEK